MFFFNITDDNFYKFKVVARDFGSLCFVLFKYNENARRRKSKIWFNVGTFFSENQQELIWFFLKEISNQFIVKYTSMNMIWLSGNEKHI